jgi:hypothetical protein
MYERFTLYKNIYYIMRYIVDNFLHKKTTHKISTSVLIYNV